MVTKHFDRPDPLLVDRLEKWWVVPVDQVIVEDIGALLYQEWGKPNMIAAYCFRERTLSLITNLVDFRSILNHYWAHVERIWIMGSNDKSGKATPHVEIKREVWLS